MLAALLSSASLQEEKQGFQKDALSGRSSTKSTLYQDEWKTIPKNTFWIQKKSKELRLLGFFVCGDKAGKFQKQREFSIIKYGKYTRFLK